MQNKYILSISLIGITLLATFLRLYHINFESLWLEELQTINFSDPRHDILTIIDISRNNGGQAFYMLLYSLFNLTSYDASVGRLVCAIMGVLAIPAIFLLVTELADAKTGLFSSLLLAVNYWHITYSQELNVYSMAFLFSTLSYWLFIRSYKHAKEIDFAGYVICSVVLLNTHSYGMLILIAQVLSIALLSRLHKPEKENVVGFVIAIITILLFAPWTRTLFNDLVRGYTWIPHPQFYFLPAYFYNYFGKDVILTIVFSFLSGLFFMGVIRSYVRERNIDSLHLIVILWLMISYLIPFVKSMLGDATLEIRFTIVSLPAWVAIISIGWSKLKNLKLKVALVVVVILSSTVNIFFVKKYYMKIRKEQLREMSQFVKTKNEFSYPMYSSNAWELNFYFKDSQIKVKRLDSINFQTDLEKFWLLQIGSTNEGITASNTEYHVVEHYSFYNTNAFLMEK